jgi:hypothetical protein
MNVAEKHQDKVEMMRLRLKNLLSKYGVSDFPMKTYLKYPRKGLELSSIYPTEIASKTN